MAVLLRKPKLLHGMILPWLATWVLALPLFHVHSLDPQESRSFSPPVLSHTVFSPDYPGEYGPRAAGWLCDQAEDHGAFSGHFPRYFESELDLLGEEDDGKRRSGIPSALFLQCSSLGHSPIGVLRHVMGELNSPAFPLLAASRHIRAPPVSC